VAMKRQVVSLTTVQWVTAIDVAPLRYESDDEMNQRISAK